MTCIRCNNPDPLKSPCYCHDCIDDIQELAGMNREQFVRYRRALRTLMDAIRRTETIKQLRKAPSYKAATKLIDLTRSKEYVLKSL